MSIPNNTFSSSPDVLASLNQYFLPVTETSTYWSNGLINKEQFTYLVRDSKLRGFETSAVRGFNNQDETTDRSRFIRSEVYTAAIINELVERFCPNYTIAADFRRRVVSTELDYFTSKYPEEEFDLTFDFRKYLNRNETINTATWTIAVVSGTDANASSMITGSPTIDGTKVTETVSNGLGDVVYEMTCEIVTDQSNTYVLKGRMRVLN